MSHRIDKRDECVKALIIIAISWWSDTHQF